MTDDAIGAAYTAAGVDTAQEGTALARLTARVVSTWPAPTQLGGVQLDLGYFANVIKIGDELGLAISADGVGTKGLIAQEMQKYDTVGIDCVAMNVNDIICVGARPLSMVDYIAVQQASPDLIDGIAKGLCEGAQQAGISISGGEIAQVRDLIRGADEIYQDRHLAREVPKDSGFDIAGAAVGLVPLNRIIVGQDIEEGDAVIGIESNGIHSNGLTLARRILFDRQRLNVQSRLPGFETSLGEELLRPTHIYVREVLQVLEEVKEVKALIHVTGEGFMNLARVASDTGYVIENLPPTPRIFELILGSGQVPEEEMFSVFNMGVGFCIVAAQQEADRVVSIVEAHGKRARRIGYALRDKEKRVYIPARGLVGKGKSFTKS